MKPNHMPHAAPAMLTPDLHLLEVMASKICHDLISPVGAVSNGVEILSEMGPDADADVTNLIAFSAAQAAAKLKALRLAYGQGGADASIKPEDALKAFADFVAGDGRITLSPTPPGVTLGGAVGTTGLAKMLICALLLMAEGLPKGGTITLEPTAEAHTIVLKASGDNAGLKDELKSALAGQTPSETLKPKQVHAAITGLLAAHYGFALSLPESSDHTFILKLHYPVV